MHMCSRVAKGASLGRVPDYHTVILYASVKELCARAMEARAPQHILLGVRVCHQSTIMRCFMIDLATVQSSSTV